MWATATSFPTIMPEDPNEMITVTGTPEDNFPDVQRAQFCESSTTASSNNYVKEYKIPTKCTQPLAIVTDPAGNVWFAETNAGRVAKFDPSTETFTEFENPNWPEMGRSMMWGLDYSSDGKLWFTDEAYDLVWIFSTVDETYSLLQFPAGEDSLPQRLEVHGSQIIVNDFTGNKITFFDVFQTDDDSFFVSVPSPVENSFTSAFAVDSDDNVWYTNWVFQGGGVLVKLDKEKFLRETPNLSFENPEENELLMQDYAESFPLPMDIITPNGISVDDQGMVWISDTSSSSIYRFDPMTETYTKYVTSPPPVSAFGNATGIIKTPISRPYWNQIGDDGMLVFNAQTSNTIGVFDTVNEKIIEYQIPSKNPNWADCEAIENCGLAQTFDFAIDGDKIWFTEWVENNIGVVDTSKSLPVDFELDKASISLSKGEQVQLIASISSVSEVSTNVPIGPLTEDIDDIQIVSSTPTLFDDLVITPSEEQFRFEDSSFKQVPITISASETAVTGDYKILIGVRSNDVTLSKFIDLEISE